MRNGIPVNFGHRIVALAHLGKDRDVREVLNRKTAEYLREPDDLAEVVASERTISGLSALDLAVRVREPLVERAQVRHLCWPYTRSTSGCRVSPSALHVALEDPALAAVEVKNANSRQPETLGHDRVSLYRRKRRNRRSPTTSRHRLVESAEASVTPAPSGNCLCRMKVVFPARGSHRRRTAKNKSPSCYALRASSQPL